MLMMMVALVMATIISVHEEDSGDFWIALAMGGGVTLAVDILIIISWFITKGLLA